METSSLLALLNESYPIQFNKLEFYRDGGSLSYIAFGDESKYFLRVIKPAFIETALQSIEIHMFLQKNHVPVPKIVPSRLYTPYVYTDETDGKRLFILYEFIEGKEPTIDGNAEDIGVLVGKLHKTMQAFHGKLLVRDKHFFIDRYIEILKSKEYPEEKVMAFKEHGNALWERAKVLPTGYCHGDLHVGNILQTQSGELILLDFDTSCYAVPMYDIALVCNSTDYFHFHADGHKKTKDNVERFLAGYRQYCQVDNLDIEVICDLIAIYHYQLQATIIEIYGLDCVDEAFLDNQFSWLMRWSKQYHGGTTADNVFGIERHADKDFR